MSIQTTQRITRRLAEEKYIEMMLEEERKHLVLEARLLDDAALEDAIESHFYNYDIVRTEDTVGELEK